MRICMDMDGVICKGPWIEPEQRIHKTYMKMEPYDYDTLTIFEEISYKHECYIITTRMYSNCIRSLEDWFRLVDCGPKLAGIIPGIRASEKYHLASMMYCDLIVDDSPRVWQDWRTTGNHYIKGGFTGPQMFLMDNPTWLENQDCKDFKFDTYVRVRSWKELGARIASLNSRLIS